MSDISHSGIYKGSVDENIYGVKALKSLSFRYWISHSTFLSTCSSCILLLCSHCLKCYLFCFHCEKNGVCVNQTVYKEVWYLQRTNSPSVISSSLCFPPYLFITSSFSFCFCISPISSLLLSLFLFPSILSFFAFFFQPSITFYSLYSIVNVLS